MLRVRSTKGCRRRGGQATRGGVHQEITYPQWLANVVMVKKNNGKWRMSVDFTDLNKACPKDHYPLPRIDYLVDNASGHQLLSFMDAFSGYNQIFMAEEDKEKTTFVTESGTYHYKVMPFGLKNAGATYQCLVNKIFKRQIGKNMKVYVDDMLVKLTEEASHIIDLQEAFQIPIPPVAIIRGLLQEKHGKTTVSTPSDHSPTSP
jgi:hypothetical protein